MIISDTIDTAIGQRSYLTASQMLHALKETDPGKRFSFKIHSMATHPGFWASTIPEGCVSYAEATLNDGAAKLFFVGREQEALKKGVSENPCSIVVREFVFSRQGGRTDRMEVTAEFTANLWDAMVETMRLVAMVHSPQDKWLSISFQGKQEVLDEKLRSGILSFKLQKEFRNLFFIQVLRDDQEIGVIGSCVIKDPQSHRSAP